MVDIKQKEPVLIYTYLCFNVLVRYTHLTLLWAGYSVKAKGCPVTCQAGRQGR